MYWSIRRVLQQLAAFSNRIAACVTVDIDVEKDHCVAVKVCLVCEVPSGSALKPRYKCFKPQSFNFREPLMCRGPGLVGGRLGSGR